MRRSHAHSGKNSMTMLRCGSIATSSSLPTEQKQGRSLSRTASWEQACKNTPQKYPPNGCAHVRRPACGCALSPSSLLSLSAYTNSRACRQQMSWTPSPQAAGETAPGHVVESKISCWTPASVRRSPSRSISYSYTPLSVCFLVGALVCSLACSPAACLTFRSRHLE